jgi:hypothetical protein
MAIPRAEERYQQAHGMNDDPFYAARDKGRMPKTFRMQQTTCKTTRAAAWVLLVFACCKGSVSVTQELHKEKMKKTKRYFHSSHPLIRGPWFVTDTPYGAVFPLVHTGKRIRKTWKY